MKRSGIPTQVAAEDGADVVELEALGGVHAADLVDAIRVRCPVGRGRDASGEACGIGPCVPGHLPGADLDIGRLGLAPLLELDDPRARAVRLFCQGLNSAPPGLCPIWATYSARSFSAIRCICASAMNCSVVPAYSFI